MLCVEDWAEIRRLYRAEKMPIKVIARVMKVSRNTVRAAVASDRPPKYGRPAKGSIVDAAEPRIRELLRAYPTMPSAVIAERIGWERSIRVLRDRVAELRPAYLPPDPASRTAYVAGEIAQCDFWFPPIMVPVGCGQIRKPTQRSSPLARAIISEENDISDTSKSAKRSCRQNNSDGCTILGTRSMPSAVTVPSRIGHERGLGASARLSWSFMGLAFSPMAGGALSVTSRARIGKRNAGRTSLARRLARQPF